MRATEEFERLRPGELRDLRLVLLHGQLRPREAAGDGGFTDGAAEVLIATTVIEVGVDVPNATVMLVEDAERFGISQLHQLRGRIGRGEGASLCLLSAPRARAGWRRSPRRGDGFQLAEIDLQLRGEGELAGVAPVRRRRAPPSRAFPGDADLLERAPGLGGAALAADPRLRGARARAARRCARARVQRRGAASRFAA